MFRAPSLTLAAAGAALLAPTLLPGGPAAEHHGAPVARSESSVSAADLLDKVRDCTRISDGLYRTDHGTAPTIPVCGTRDVVHWKADLDIDCDGRPGPRCNAATDPTFSAATAFAQSDGRPLDSATLPHIVVPTPSAVWDYREHGVRGGSVAAVIHEDRVQYAVVGDVGPAHIIGEASYATAEALGIDPDPLTGGTAADVTYIVFKDSRVTPIEDADAAVTLGEELARRFVDGG
ncbi:glycoside hydrolase family 75 protein [Streptomyces sp. NPDC029526]|uniref:glycoside hydrolase family 75 protein n=1 Tax=Streptomyces sp. NPDC029526 TaxID=3155728 RepID=UPI003405F206